jgi:hypothetical protein
MLIVGCTNTKLHVDNADDTNYAYMDCEITEVVLLIIATASDELVYTLSFS